MVSKVLFICPTSPNLVLKSPKYIYKFLGAFNGYFFILLYVLSSSINTCHSHTGNKTSLYARSTTLTFCPIVIINIKQPEPDNDSITLIISVDIVLALLLCTRPMFSSKRNNEELKYNLSIQTVYSFHSK